MCFHRTRNGLGGDLDDVLVELVEMKDLCRYPEAAAHSTLLHVNSRNHVEEMLGLDFLPDADGHNFGLPMEGQPSQVHRAVGAASR